MKASLLSLTALLLASTAFAEGFQPERVVLSSGGLAEISASVAVSGPTVVTFDAPLAQVDDVLKSLVILGAGVSVLSVDLAGREPLTDTFTALPFKPEDLQNSITLLAALKGVQVEVKRNDRTLRGIVIGVETIAGDPDRGGAPEHARLSIATEGGVIEHVAIDESTSVAILDQAMQAALVQALTALALDRSADGRTIEITLDSSGPATATLLYVIGAPVWKPTWRVVLPADEGDAQFQGWAVLENRTGVDWKGVDLTLSSGTPVALSQGLYESVLVPRPRVPLRVGQRLRPDMDQGVFEPESAAEFAAAAPAPAYRLAAPGAGRAEDSFAFDMASQNLAGGLDVQATETLAAATFQLPDPVDLAVGRSLTLPFFDGEANAERVSMYQPNVSTRHPIAAVRVKNDSAVTLPGGIVTVYESGVGFVGDAEFAGAAPGEERVLPYALDPKVNIAVDVTSNSAINTARAADGFLVIETGRVQKTSYRLEGDPAAGRRILIEHQANSGWEVTADGAEVEGRDGERYRLMAELDAGENETVTVTETTVDAQRWAIIDTPDQVILDLLALGDRIDGKLREPLQKIIDVRAQTSRLANQISNIDGTISRIRQDQERVRANLQAVDPNGELGRTYLERMRSQEDEMAKLEADREAAVTALETARTELADLVRGLTL